jgi:tetratricopeptide (TPR) repeat protein
MKIAACMIVRGDEKLTKTIDSIIDGVDQIFITTTQKKIHRKHPKITWSHFDWIDDFSAARNFNFSQAEGYDYLLWIDSDDVLEGESPRKVALEMKRKGLDGIYADYNYEIDKETGEVIIVHPRERIVKNGVYTWKGMLHETLIPKTQPQTQYIKDFVINHYPSEKQKEENLERNVRILVKDYKEQQKAGKEIDPRTEYYLARCYFDMHTKDAHRQASLLLQDYLQHSGWDEERMQAWVYLGNIFFLDENYPDAIHCFFSAIKERPEYPTAYINLGRTYAMKKDYEKAEFYIRQGLSIKQPATALVITPRDDKLNALHTLYMCAYARREMDKALKIAQKIYQMMPSEDNKHKVDTLKEIIKERDQLKSIATIVKDMDENKEPGIDKLLNALPEHLKDSLFVDKLRGAYTKPKKWPRGSMVYYAASDLEPWSPKSLETGVGGSEEAIIYLAKEWVKLGYQVTVYAYVGDMEGTYDGVEYKNYVRFNHNDNFDVLIGWRNPMLFKYNNFNARVTLLDLHDIPNEGDYKDIVNKVDKIMVKSPFHRSLLPNIPDDKFVIINNGIDVDKLGKVKAKKKRYKIFWGSSYDRGLKTLLQMWIDIKKAEPLAELHICYGWQLYEAMLENDPVAMKEKSEMDQLMKQPGITHHSRVGKKELYEIAASCAIWAYPTNFEEISCITAMYCMALGTVPVVFDYAALQTTVQHGIKIEPKDNEAYLQALIKQLTKPKEFKEMKNHTLGNMGWKDRARDWTEVFNTPDPQDIKLSLYTPTIRTGFWNIMAENLSRQTYPPHEWIIVDDYKENRQKIADKYAKKYGLNIVYIHKPDRAVKRTYGLSSANNQAVLRATGDVLVWLQDFVIIPTDGLERVARFHRRYPEDLLAPVDEYWQVEADTTNTEDWFNGETKLKGKWMRENIRIGNNGLRETDNEYDFELNFGSIPLPVLRELNGFWEIFDDALGYDNTEIALRAMKRGSRIYVDEHLRAICLDHWEPLKDKPEELGEKRTHNLNDPRYIFLTQLMEEGIVTEVRDEKLDSKLRLNYTIPEELDQDQAVEWMKANLDDIVKRWREECESLL